MIVGQGFCRALSISILILLAEAGFAFGQLPARVPDIPPKFALDTEMAARLRPQLDAESVPATGSYGLGAVVFENIVEQISAASNPEFAWQLRIFETNGGMHILGPMGVCTLRGVWQSWPVPAADSGQPSHRMNSLM